MQRATGSVRGDIQQLIEGGEGISVSFARRVSAAYINERAMIERMAALANGEGGTLLVGVDSDGTVSGCHPFHGDHTDPVQLASTVRRYTRPPLDVAVEIAGVGEREVVALTAQPSATPVATAWGLYRARRLNTSGVAVDEGMEPAQLFTRYRDANGVDWALNPAVGAGPGDLDDAAFDAYRRLADKNGGNRALVQRGNDSLVRALGFRNDTEHPLTLGAILLFGTEEAIARHLPYHFAVLADARPPRTTWRTRAALPVLIEALTRDPHTLGGALPFALNALIHRDYFLPGAVYIHVDEERTTVTSPGPLPRGITTADLAGPGPAFAPRSLYLSTALAHTGVTSGAGAGVEDATKALVEGGFGEPSYAGTHSQAVTVRISPQANQAPRTTLSRGDGVLDALEQLGTASSSEVAERAGLSQQQAYRALRRLVDKGQVARSGSTRMTRYSLK